MYLLNLGECTFWAWERKATRRFRSLGMLVVLCSALGGLVNWRSRQLNAVDLYLLRYCWRHEIVFKHQTTVPYSPAEEKSSEVNNLYSCRRNFKSINYGSIRWQVSGWGLGNPGLRARTHPSLVFIPNPDITLRRHMPRKSVWSGSIGMIVIL